MTEVYDDEDSAEQTRPRGRLGEVDGLRKLWQAAAENGTPLPGESQLAAMLGVSRPSIREALARFEEQGLIYRRRGAQTTVNRAALEIVGRFDQQGEFLDVLTNAGYRASQELLLAERIALSDIAATTFEVAPGSPGMRVVKRWRADGTAVRVAVDTFPLIGDSDFDWRESTLEIVRAMRDEPPQWELALPRAVSLDRVTAEWLEVAEGTSVLLLETVGVTASGKRVFSALDYHRSDLISQGMIRNVT